jgi:hypothetical protein
MPDVKLCAKCGQPLTPGNRLEIFRGNTVEEVHKTCGGQWARPAAHTLKAHLLTVAGLKAGRA